MVDVQTSTEPFSIHFQSEWFHKSHWWWRWCVWGPDTGAGQGCHPTDWHSVRLLYTFIHNETRQRMVQVFDAHTTDQSGPRWLEDGPMGIQRPEPSCRDWLVATGMNGASARAGHLLWRSGRWQQMWWHPHPQCQWYRRCSLDACLRTDASLLLWCISLLAWFTGMDSNKSKHLLLQRSILSK